MSNLDLDTYSINLKCPKCAQIIPEAIGKLKKDPIATCSTCGNFDVHADELQKGIERVESSIKDIRNALKKTDDKR